MIALIQIVLHDNWINYANTVVFGCDKQPSPLVFDPEKDCSNPRPQFLAGLLYFIVFTIFCSYILVALFIGAINIAMEEEQERRGEVVDRKKFTADASSLRLQIVQTGCDHAGRLRQAGAWEDHAAARHRGGQRDTHCRAT